jgi:aminoglycoside 6'-N-acetyltransferase
MLVEYLFTTSAVHRLWAWTGSDNLAEQKALEKCGFKREGTVREAIFRGGAWHDSIIYGLLRHEL